MSSSNPNLRFRNTWLLIGYCLIILVIYLSLTSNPVQMGTEIPHLDKFLHMLAYFSLMFWFAQIYHNVLQRIIWAIFFVVMGVVLEYGQSFDPAREGGIADAIANTAGVLIGLLMANTELKYVLLRFDRLL